jgi:hypothetical protein
MPFRWIEHFTRFIYYRVNLIQSEIKALNLFKNIILFRACQSECIFTASHFYTAFVSSLLLEGRFLDFKIFSSVAILFQLETHLFHVSTDVSCQSASSCALSKIFC